MNNLNLALGGGGTKGFTHIGVIRQLEKEGYEIKGIAGTSDGGIVGALYCYGYSTFEIEKFSKELNYTEIFNRSKNDAPSILGLGGLYKLLEKKIGGSTFDDPSSNRNPILKSGLSSITGSGAASPRYGFTSPCFVSTNILNLSVATSIPRVCCSRILFFS